MQDGTGHILACIPLVDVAPLVGESAPPIVKLPGVTVGIALMRELGNALAASAASAATSNSTEDGDSGQRLYMDLHKCVSMGNLFVYGYVGVYVGVCACVERGKREEEENNPQTLAHQWPAQNTGTLQISVRPCTHAPCRLSCP